MKHRQKQVIIDGKKVIVDVGILPLVNWFNSNSNVVTTSSCYGDRKPNGNGALLPYVSFVSYEGFRKYLLRAVRKYMGDRKSSKYFNYVEMEHTVYEGNMGLDSCSSIYFSDRQDMKKFYNFVKWYRYDC